MKLRTNIFYVSVLVIDCHCVGECTLSTRHRLQIRILSIMKREQTKKGASIGCVWVSSCFIDPSHVVFSLNRKNPKEAQWNARAWPLGSIPLVLSSWQLMNPPASTIGLNLNQAFSSPATKLIIIMFIGSIVTSSRAERSSILPLLV